MVIPFVSTCAICPQDRKAENESCTGDGCISTVVDSVGVSLSQRKGDVMTREAIAKIQAELEQRMEGLVAGARAYPNENMLDVIHSAAESYLFYLHSKGVVIASVPEGDLTGSQLLKWESLVEDKTRVPAE